MVWASHGRQYMKAFLATLLFLINIIGNVFAEDSCNDFYDFSWSVNSSKTKATFEVKSTSPKPIYITQILIQTKSGGVMKKITRNSKYGTRANFVMYISAYGKSDYTTSVSSLNPDLIGAGKSEAILYCSFIKPKPREVQNLNIKKEKSWFKWQYIFLIPLAFVFFGWVIEQFEGSKTNKKSKRLRPKQYSDYTTNTENFIEDVWEGRKPLGESFWLYFIVANFIISFGSAFLLEYFDSKFFLIPLIASNVWAGVGTWNSSDNYQKEKIKQKQGYGWAYTAKVFIVLNFLALAGNVIDIFNT